MDPTIAAAWITGGVGGLGIAGTVATAIVGSRSTRKATETTVAAGAATTAATLAAAREDRLWEKRCAGYEETLAGLLYRQSRRREDFNMYRWDGVTEQQVKEFFDAYEPPRFFEAQGRLLAYASDAVIAASNGASKAHGEVRELFQQYQMMADDNKRASETGQHGTAHDGKETVEVLRAVLSTFKDAEAKDDLLIVAIRDELRSKPEAAILPASATPAKRRRFWHRRQA
jgi:hypothetical protein